MVAAIAISLLLSLTPPNDTLDLTRVEARPCTPAENVVALTAPPLPLLAPHLVDACAPCNAAPAITLAPCPPCPRSPASGVEVRLAGTWANVDVDGERIFDNQMGTFVLPLAAGEHVVRFSQPLAEPQEVRLSVGSEPVRPVVVKLRPRPARLRVKGAPDGGLVRVGDRRVPVGAGEVIIEMAVERRVTLVVEVLGPTGVSLVHREVRLSPGEETTLALQPEP